MDMERIVTVCYFCDESYESAELNGAHRCKKESEAGYSVGKWSDDDDWSPIVVFRSNR
jgi:hypothetical protein